MKKILTVLAMLLVLVQVGTFVFVSAAEPQSFDDYLITHWDFEGTGEAALVDKATKGQSADTLSITGTVVLDNGVAMVPSTSGNLLSAVGSTADLNNFQNKTIIMKYKSIQGTNSNMPTPISKINVFQFAPTLIQTEDAESPYDPVVRIWDGTKRLTNAYKADTKNWTGPDDSFHYLIISFDYDATAATLTHSYYYSKTEYPADKDGFIEMYSNTETGVSENVVKSNENFMIGKWAATDTDRGLSYEFDDIKIYDTAMTIEQAYGTLNIDISAATATTVATTVTTTAETTKAATTAAATTAAATAATTAAEEGGCGGVIAIPAVALVGVVSAAGCMIKRKKK